MSEVVLDKVNKLYPNGYHAVTDLSLDIADGEFLVLVGPSGCGKSTALRMVAGLESISGGTLKVGDRVVNDVHPSDRDIAMVFQNYALYPHMTVRQNIAFALKLNKTPKEELNARVAEAAKILELDEWLDRKPGQLSGGQRQRVAMGRAIVRRPAAFLMDEPLSNLDAKLRVQMRSEIARIQRDLGTTTIYVTHDQVEAMTMGDRVAVMKKGVLQQVDTPQQLYDNPNNLFVAAFIGSPSMNLLEGSVTQSGAGVSLKLGSQELHLDDNVLNARPGLRRALGQQVAAGIRPEDLHDPAERPNHPANQRLKAMVDLTEALGSDMMVHARIDAPRVVTDDVKEGDEGAEEAVGEGRPNMMARFGPRSTVKFGDTVELCVDVERLHFFDSDGAAIRG